MNFTLAYWHTLKHAVHKVWKCFALELWAPMWHNLYPSGLFLIKGKHPGDELLHMIYAANAYHEIKANLYDMLAEDGLLSETNSMMVKDLIFLFEFAIPAVVLYLV